MSRPDAAEYDPYFGRYVDQVPEGGIEAHLQTLITDTLDLLIGLDGDRWDHRYAPEKWNVKELVGHVIDTERLLTTRALRWARGDTTPLPGFDQDPYVEGANFSGRPRESFLDELLALRASTVALYRGLPAESHLRRGVAEEKEMSVRAVFWVVAGHEVHHIKVLRERYLA